MTRGQNDWLGLFCATLSFATSCSLSGASKRLTNPSIRRPPRALKIVLSIGRRPCLINGHLLTSLHFDNISFHNDFAGQNQAIMSCSISTLLTRNLHKVFGENDPARRRAALDEIFTEDCVFCDPTRGP